MRNAPLCRRSVHVLQNMCGRNVSPVLEERACPAEHGRENRFSVPEERACSRKAGVRSVLPVLEERAYLANNGRGEHTPFGP